MSRGKIVVEGTPEELKANLRGELVTVELGDVNGRIEDAAELVRAIDGATEVGVDGRLLRARVPNGAKAIPAILSTLESRDFQVDSVTTARPSLDDVYLHYTGRDFATEDEQARRLVIQLLRQTGWMIVRQLRNLMREPIWIIVMIVQPLIWLLLYGQLFSRVGVLRGGASTYIEFLTPGIICMNAFFGGSWAGMAMITDLDRHVVDRFLAARHLGSRSSSRKSCARASPLSSRR